MAVVDLPKLRDPDKLRPWLYSIARHQALRTLRARRREAVTDELPDEPSPEAGPDALAARNELAAFVAEAEGGLSDRDREVLDLTYRHGLTGAELSQALGVSDASAKKMVQRLRDTVERSLGAVVIVRQVRTGRNRCPELGTIIGNWDGQFTVLVRKRISRHIESCAHCDESRERLVSPAALLGAAPVFIPAPSWLRNQALTRMGSATHVTTGTVETSTHVLGHAAGGLSMVTSRVALWVGAVVAVPAIAVGVAVGWPALHGAPLGPAQISPAGSTPAISHAPNTPVREPAIPPTQVNVPPPQSNTSASPSAGSTNSDDPNSTDHGTQPIQQAPSPAPAATAAPAVTGTPSSRVAPASQGSTAPAAPPRQRPPIPTVKHCANGDTVARDQSCPAPQLPPPSQPSPAPNCPHVAVPGSSTCARTAPGG